MLQFTKIPSETLKTNDVQCILFIAKTSINIYHWEAAQDGGSSAWVAQGRRSAEAGNCAPPTENIHHSFNLTMNTPTWASSGLGFSKNEMNT
jgi:hypothetical protein